MTSATKTGLTIRAVRVAELGPFDTGVAVEDMSGGLDVLTGPNEAGKSTLFRALTTLVGVDYTSTAKSVQALKSDKGGAPLVEADLEIDGRLWRIRKRYLAQKSADVIDLTGGERWRGADAEKMVQTLLSGDGRDALRAMVWVEQTKSFALPDAKADLSQGLAGLIETEAADAAGAGRIRRLREAVTVRLADLVTAANRRPRKGGPLDAAMKSRAEIENRYASAEDKAERAADRALRLTALKDAAARDLAPAAIAAASGRQALAQKAVSEAEQARERLNSADERLKGRQLVRDNAERDLALFTRRVDDADKLQVAAAVQRTARQQADEALRAAEHQRSELLAQRQTVAAGQDQTRRQLAALSAAEALVAARGRADDADHRLAAATEIDEKLRELNARLATNPVDAAGVAEARRLHSRLNALLARLEASSARITVAYLPDAHGRISIEGAHVNDGEALLVGEPTVLTIAGVGTLMIEPAAAAGQSLLTERDSAERALTDQLDRLGVADLAAAETALSARHALEQEVAAARARLTAAAPDGLQALRQQRDLARIAAGGSQLESELSAVKPSDQIGREHLMAIDAEATARLAEIDRSLGAAEAELRKAGEHAVRAEAQLGGLLSRHEELVQALPPDAERAGALLELHAAAERVSAAYDAALRERQSWALAAPDAAAFAELKVAAETAKREADTLQRRRSEIEREMAELDGALRQDGADGAGAEVALLREQLAQAQARVDDVELEVAALALLADRLDGHGSQHRERVLRPLLERLQPLLSQLLPGARLALDGPLLVSHLERGGGQDAWMRLSDGTREQIALVVRLAYARLMAERGSALPLVLDDALVFSDDKRLATMFGLLAEAARYHQVLVLSCRAQSFDGLAAACGGRRLAISAWDSEDIQAAAHGTAQLPSTARALAG